MPSATISTSCLGLSRAYTVRCQLASYHLHTVTVTLRRNRSQRSVEPNYSRLWAYNVCRGTAAVDRIAMVPACPPVNPRSTHSHIERGRDRDDITLSCLLRTTGTVQGIQTR